MWFQSLNNRFSNHHICGLNAPRGNLPIKDCDYGNDKKVDCTLLISPLPIWVASAHQKANNKMQANASIAKDLCSADKVTVKFGRASITSANLLGTRGLLRDQPATMCCLLPDSRQADAESRVTSAAMRELPHNDLGGEKITCGTAQDLHSVRAK